MRINILQHTANEGPGMILDWANQHEAPVYTYHPDQFQQLPTATETDLLIILGGPMSPNDDLSWIVQERQLIKELLAADKPILGICFGAQQITKALGYPVTKSPAKEVGWAPVTRESNIVPGIPAQLSVLHWHEEMFAIPKTADLLFSSAAVKNQGFVLNQHVVGLQFHLEPTANNVREIVVNDFAYLQGSIFKQTAAQVLKTPVPAANRTALWAILDYLTNK